MYQDSRLAIPSTYILLEYFLLVLVKVWDMLLPPPWNISRTEVFSFSNLYRKSVSYRILASAGSVLVHAFADTMLLHISEALWMIYCHEIMFLCSIHSFIFKQNS